jgi:hypothetical protein
MLYVLVIAPNWSGWPGCVTSLPSWSCGFDSRRPLQLVDFFRFTVYLIAAYRSAWQRFSVLYCLRRNFKLTHACAKDRLELYFLPKMQAPSRLVMRT